MLRRITLPILLLASTSLYAQTPYWNEFGPDRAAGAFLNITREHRISENAIGVAEDSQQRLLVLNEWDEAATTNLDCAVTRHVRRARALDMGYTGPEDLEGTRRVAADMGGTGFDTCSSLSVDRDDRAVIAGTGDTGEGLGGFLIRLDANGNYDTNFAGDGKFFLRNLAAFDGAQTRLAHAVALANRRVVACGTVTRGSERRLFAMRVTAAGQLDTSFNSTGIRELDFNGAGADEDSCARLLVLPDGDLIVAGITSGGSGNGDYALARIDTGGSLDTTFSGNGLLVMPNGSQLAATPVLSDLGYDAVRDRVLFSCYLVFAALEPSGCIVALHANGTLDTDFDGDGRLIFRYDQYSTIGVSRNAGGTRVRRLLVRADGVVYALGTHFNGGGDATNYGASDVARLRVNPDGSVDPIGSIVYQSFPTVRQSVEPEQDLRSAETLVDAIWYRGSIVFIADRPRYPANVFDHDGDGVLDEPGPIAPVVAAVNVDRLFAGDFEFDGIPAADTLLMPLIDVPAGFGRYCSVRDAVTGTYGLLPAGAADDPCASLIGSNPNNRIERAGLYDQSGGNWVAGVCSGGYISTFGGNGATAMNQSFAASTGRTQCIFTNFPNAMPIFSRPYDGAHVGITQAFNHDPYLIPLDVSEFGQPQGTYDACFIDQRGRRRSVGNPNANPSTCTEDGSGVNEPAVDIPVTGTRFAVAMATGRVTMAVPRHVPVFTPAGTDPYQREVFIRHQVGAGRYAEVFSTYYAHMQDTAVRRGQNVVAGTVLGRIGTTGASSGEHLHLSVHRNRNLTYRGAFEFNFSGGNRMDRDGSVSSIDPWGWQAPEGADPWGWRFRVHPGGDTLRDDAGSFSTNLWRSGEAPTID